MKFEIGLLVNCILFSSAFYMTWNIYSFLTHCFKLDTDSIIYAWYLTYCHVFSLDAQHWLIINVVLLFDKPVLAGIAAFL